MGVEVVVDYRGPQVFRLLEKVFGVSIFNRVTEINGIEPSHGFISAQDIETFRQLDALNILRYVKSDENVTHDESSEALISKCRLISMEGSTTQATV